MGLCRKREGWGFSVLVKSLGDEVDDIVSVFDGSRCGCEMRHEDCDREASDGIIG